MLCIDLCSECKEDAKREEVGVWGCGREGDVFVNVKSYSIIYCIIKLTFVQ